MATQDSSGGRTAAELGTGSTGPIITDEIAMLLYRLELAGSRHRAARAELMRVDEREVAALEHLACTDALTPTDLGHRLGLSSGGVSVLLDRLAQAGHVERTAHPDDKRKRILRLTPAGAEWLRVYLEPVTAPLERAAAWLSADDRAVLCRFLDHVVALRQIEASQTPRHATPRDTVPAQRVW